MGIVSRPRSHPALVRAIVRWFVVRDVDAMPIDRLRDALVPEGLARTDAGSIWDDTIRVAAELGLVGLENGTVMPGAHDLRSVAEDSELFRVALRGVVFAPENADGLWDDVGGKWSSDGANEFSRIAAWMLEQDPVGFDKRTVYDRAREAVSGPSGSKLIENVEQLRAYERWAESLGVAEVLSFARDDEQLIPDCTVAITGALSKATSGRWQAASTVRRLILEEVPVLRGGRLAAGAPAAVRAAEGMDSPGVKHAMQRLTEARLLDAETRSDSGSMAIGFDGKRATHFRWVRHDQEDASR